MKSHLMHVQGTVFQQPTYKAYPGKVFKQGQEAQCRNEALAAGLTVYQLPQDVLPVLEVVMAIIYITRVYCSLIFSSVRPQQTPKQRTEYITQYGTGQRLQVLLAKSPSGKLDLTFKTLNNADTKAINDQLTDAQKAEVRRDKISEVSTQQRLQNSTHLKINIHTKYQSLQTIFTCVLHAGTEAQRSPDKVLHALATRLGEAARQAYQCLGNHHQRPSQQEKDGWRGR
ncbi:hypothetical protein [Bosea sp. (in: a-proteobacteria)]|uniref:hypothetical protein n=1 Tax=Bosea sp. (in: a-proteobacteria) TaxID=1871050 RepID=UPI004034F669